MILKNLIIGIFFISLLSGCAQNGALLGPAYTLATTGNAYNAGLTYGGNELIIKTTGKSVTQNFKDALVIKKEDTEFEKLIKKNIKKTRKKLNLSNQ
jgi:hypothetical protein|tara:strand:- start:79 stop:369 length:291 start_codon:yes stop_codon:yes gene_type:complete